MIYSGEIDYEKLYKDALERAKKIDIDEAYASQGTIAKTIFPELAESKDERIRKAIIELLKEVGRDDTGISENAKCMIAYLEKQKEQNKITIEQVYKEFINPEKLKGAKTNKYIRAQLLWELMHNGIITEVDYQYLIDDNHKPWTEEEYLKAYRKGFDVSEKLKQKEQKPLTAEETELNSIAFLEQMGYTCIPPRKEQKSAESRKRNKPKESWLSKAKYEIEHADELLRQRQEELREIRELKKQEQHPSSKFQSGDWVVYDGPLGHAILQVKNVVDGRYTFVDNESTLLVEDSDKFLRPLTPKDVEKKVEWSEEDKKNLKQCIEIVGGWEIDYDYANSHYSNWLKSLPERFNLQPKEERSEEDEATIGTLINYFEGDALDCSTDEMIRRIRALRPSWKPSEEQMDAFEDAMTYIPEFYKPKSNLASLLRDLKKLM